MARPSINQVIFSGYLNKDPQVVPTDNGDLVRSLLVMSDYKGEKQFVTLVAFGKLAETMKEYCVAGTKLTVFGRLQIRKYQKDGVDQWANDYILDRIFFNDESKAAAEVTEAAPGPVARGTGPTGRPAAPRAYSRPTAKPAAATSDDEFAGW